MSRLILLPLVAVLASLCTVLYLRRSPAPLSIPSSHLLSPSRSSLHSTPPLSFGSSPPVSVRPSPPHSLRPPVPLRRSRPLSSIRSSASCASDPLSCGEGSYCCQGSCLPAVYANVTFAADEAADLYVCGWQKYESLASSSAFGEVASYAGWLPCTETYLNVRNQKYDGGASIAFIAEENGILWSWGSGYALPVESQYGYDADFVDAVPFEEIVDEEMFETMIHELAAFPVKDPRHPENEVTNMKFVPPTCK